MHEQLGEPNSRTARTAMFSVYVFLINIFVKYFAPDIITKVLPILSVGVLILANRRNIFKFYYSSVGYFIFGMLYLMGSIYSVSPIKGLMYALSYIIATLFVFFAMRYNIDWKKIFIFISGACVLMTVGTILQSQNPLIVNTIVSYFSYSSQERYLMEAWARNQWFSGWFPDRAPAAFFSSMLCGVGIHYLLRNRKQEKLIARFFGLLLFVVGVWGIFLTAKRGLLFGMLLATLICYLVNRHVVGKPILLIIVSIVVFCVLGYIILINISGTNVMLSRIFENDDFYTNRLEIYKKMLDNINDHFFFGTGTASADSLLGVGGHNIYLTVLMENGIIGAMVFVVVWMLEIIRTMQSMASIGSNKNDEGLAILTCSLFIQVFFVIYGMSGNPLYDNYILNFYFLGVLMNENVRFKMQKNKYCDNNLSFGK